MSKLEDSAYVSKKQILKYGEFHSTESWYCAQLKVDDNTEIYFHKDQDVEFKQFNEAQTHMRIKVGGILVWVEIDDWEIGVSFHGFYDSISVEDFLKMSDTDKFEIS